MKKLFALIHYDFSVTFSCNSSTNNFHSDTDRRETQTFQWSDLKIECYSFIT